MPDSSGGFSLASNRFSTLAPLPGPTIKIKIPVRPDWAPRNTVNDNACVYRLVFLSTLSNGGNDIVLSNVQEFFVSNMPRLTYNPK